MMDDRFVGESSAAVSSSILADSSKKDLIIGFSDDLIALKDRLCRVSSKLRVIPIVGMGGIGKTTLARKTYDDPLIAEYFHIRAWVTVSQDYSARRFFPSLVDSMKLVLKKQAREGKLVDADVEEEVYKYLKGKRYLIVIDDVWSTKVWDDVRHAFPDDGNGSRVMLSTRLWDVAIYPDSNSPPHEMRFMNDSQSWDLLKGKVFSKRNCPHELEDVGKEIARRCGGLPLAVVLVAGVLSAVDETKAPWEEIEKVTDKVVGMKLEAILSLSYKHLPHHLRPCFLFIGGFPEDADLLASVLIKLWVAEGFLKHEDGCSKSLEEVAEEYLEDLVKRNLVIVTIKKSNGKIKRCALHDMVRDLCIRKSHDEKFLYVIDGRVDPQYMLNERRVCFKRCSIDNIWGPTIRTILGFHVEKSSTWLDLLSRFRLMGVLLLSHEEDVQLNLFKPTYNSEHLPSQVLFELFHLRYLALMGHFKIPSAISNLENLQTLVTGPTSHERNRKWTNSRVKSFFLPLEIWRMSLLRHLVLYYPHSLPHPSPGSNRPLGNLQTLFSIRNFVWNEKIPQMIPNVKRLGLVYAFNEDYHLHHLKYLHYLEKLEVIGYHDFSWKWQDRSFPRTLKKLNLVGGGFPWEDMTVVGSLPDLQVLKLLDNACTGETWETNDGEFPQLKYLKIEESNIREWITRSSHFPRLKCVALLSCYDLREIPESIGEIPTLEWRSVEILSWSQRNRLKRIKRAMEMMPLNFA